ncbi:MAG: calcineurin-like phosphoesterase family protein [Dysgonamonadaceae bacterium]|jgi:hypothetical protein|nr:calcineurin-like phosphoesterase family protein [Dysgonamonadaceae bacterium]
MKQMNFKLLPALFLFSIAIHGCKAEEDHPVNPETEQGIGPNTLHGVITDNGKHPVPGVVVSDGFTCTQTQVDGSYRLEKNAHAYYVFYSLPEQYEVNLVDGLPSFFKTIEDGRQRYDFLLKSLAAVETDFHLFCIADPQVKSTSQIARFKNESVKDIRQHASTKATPCYGITLGDIVGDTPQYFPNMFSEMHRSFLGMPLFQLIGNHDHNKDAAGDREAQQKFMETFGPLNYSFNRGEVHIVAMDNILHAANGSNTDYRAGFTESQVRWLAADLDCVPKHKMVILCVHAPFDQGADSGGALVNKDLFYRDVLKLLAPFAEAHIMAGHTHNCHNYLHNIDGKEIYEHDMGTICGAWWYSTICTDGCPNGYSVFSITGNTINNWYYKATRYDADFQIRMHRGRDVFTGGAPSWSLQYPYTTDDVIIANVWNADNRYWTVNLYENNVLTGRMNLYSGYDAWATAYHYGLGRTSSSYKANREHMFWLRLRDPNATDIKVEAIDKFGNKYYQTVITGPSPDDYPRYN